MKKKSGKLPNNKKSFGITFVTYGMLFIEKLLKNLTRYKIQDTRNFISCRLRLTNNISSELFSDKQSKNETNVKGCNRNNVEIDKAN